MQIFLFALSVLASYFLSTMTMTASGSNYRYEFHLTYLALAYYLLGYSQRKAKIANSSSAHIGLALFNYQHWKARENRSTRREEQRMIRTVSDVTSIYSPVLSSGSMIKSRELQLLGEELKKSN